MSAVAKEVVPTALPKACVQALTSLAEPLTHDQLLWASGYLAGVAQSKTAPLELRSVQHSLDEGRANDRWTVLYASETGNSRRVADQLAARIKTVGAVCRIMDMVEYRPREIKKESRIIIVAATHGLGEPPEGCEAFFEYLADDRAPQLEALHYAVLALGDSSYDDFCTAGRELDERLAALGGQRLIDRVECDVDYDEAAESWIAGVLEIVNETQADAPAGITPTPRLVSVAAPAVTRDNPFTAVVLVNQKITGRDSTKDVRHLELALEGGVVGYEPGDALGIWPRNDARTVLALAEEFKLEVDKEVALGEEAMSLRQALTERLELSQVSASLLRAYSSIRGDDALESVLADRSRLTKFLKTHQVIDVFKSYPASLDEQTLVQTLRRVTPRLYSIASSPLVNDDEVHLTVALLETREGRLGATSQLLDALPSSLPVFVEPNARFRLPADPDAPVIMIGPGTGVAPFRAFVQHREAQGALGETWLFFGDRNFSSDFLYQLEWRRALKRGALTRLDVAFSRDQDEKFYVQTRMRERRSEIFRWLEEGAYVYVCGDMHRMAPDVHATLIEIAAYGLGKGTEAGEDYLKALRAAGRYRRDVY